MARTLTATVAMAVWAASLCACQSEGLPITGPAQDLAASRDLATPPDFALVPPDLTNADLALPPTLSFTITSIAGPGAITAGPDSYQFTVPTPSGKVDRVSFSVGVLRANSTYLIAVTWKDAEPNGWLSALMGIPTTATSSGMIQTGGSAGPFPTAINLAATAAATEAQVLITVTNAADASDYGVYTATIGPA